MKQNRGNPRGQIVNRSHSGGLSVGEYWCRLLVENEWMFAQGGRLVMDDDDLTAAAFHAFPDRRDSAVFRDVKRLRSRYNRGVIACQRGKVPRVQSYRYMIAADGIAYRVTPRGKVLPEAQQIPQRVRDCDRIRRKEEFDRT
jgi:hypothetical protein